MLQPRVFLSQTQRSTPNHPLVESLRQVQLLQQLILSAMITSALQLV